jgi:hypothetical protein
VIVFVAKQEIHDFPFPPEMLKQGFFINFRTSQQRDVDMISKKLESQYSEDFSYF